MKPRRSSRVILAAALAAAVIFAATRGRAGSAAAAPDASGLDTADITRVEITGESSSLKLTTAADMPYRAVAAGRRSGWFSRWYSSWFFEDCPSSTDMRIEGSTLLVNVRPPAWSSRAWSSPSWFGLSDCVNEIRINLPKDGTVAIKQDALQARLSGDYAAITLAARAADVALDGHATAIDLRGAAMRAHIAFDVIRRDETISISVQSLEADLSFGKAAPISYTVAAKAALVDSALPNTPGAKPSVTIEADYVHATIR